jgi:tRNA pseudouridine38-40 synthase
MKTYKMVLSYDGTNFAGWQIQPNAITIQQLIEEKLLILTKEAISVVGAGRTDAGVHALGQTAHFSTHFPIDSDGLLKSLNGMLPQTIRVITLEEAPLDFHARYSAKNKVYHYHLSTEKFQSPFRRLYSLHVGQKIDLEGLKQGAKYLLGTHDFTSFSNQPLSGACGKNPIRTIDRLEVIEEHWGVRLEFEGKSFLYKMVRNCVGTLLEVAGGKRDPEQIKTILEAKDRKLGGKAAPPHGLFLVRIDY